MHPTCHPVDSPSPTPPPPPEPGSSTSPSDPLAALVGRMAGQDEAALAQFYALTLSRVYGLALRITGRRELAEEVALETYWQAWREAARFDARRGEPLAWLMMMTRSRALDALRRLDTAVVCPDPDTLVEESFHATPSPVDRLIDTQAHAALRYALGRLSPIQRQMLGLAYFRDLTHQEISQQTGLPLGTVKSHIKRAQDALRATLKQDAPE